MGRIREQAQGEVLPAHRRWQTPPADRSRQMESHGRCDRGNLAGYSGASVSLASRLRSWSQTLFRRDQRDREMETELRFHVESHADDLARNGLSPDEALRQARLAFGGVARTKEECRDATGVSFIESIAQDTRFGLRTLRKNP